MRNFLVLFLLSLFFFINRALADEKIEKISLYPSQSMTRADIYYFHHSNQKNFKAILILVPGLNGNGKYLLQSVQWREFAHKYKLGLVGLSFASSIKDINENKGYYYPSTGSGSLLLAGLRKIGKGYDKLPILMYGFSGGAHFTSRFVEWRPQKIKAWVAYSAGWWDSPRIQASNPPGIVACGSKDYRLKASRDYFWLGRELNKPWLWMELNNVGHTTVDSFDNFIRKYFAAILDGNIKNDIGCWVDIYNLKIVDTEYAKMHPCATGWLPAKYLYSEWKRLCRENGYENIISN